MSLLREIQDELSKPETDVTAVLRKCKILAARLKSTEFAQWVEWELGGYPKDQPIPEYRRLTVIYFASFISLGWRVPRAVVPSFIIPQKFRDKFDFVEFSEGIAKAASLARSEHQIAIQRPELTLTIQGKMYPEMECHSAWGEISPIEFQQMLSAVSGRILDFSLKVEAENPAAGEASPQSEPVAAEKVSSLVQNIILGNVGAIAQHSTGFTQAVSVGASPQEILKFVTEFTQHLNELRLDERQKERAEAQLAALKAESHSEPDTVIVKQAGRTLRSITEGAIASLLATAAQPTVWHWIHEMLKTLSG
jgi:hypothetical protein